MDLKAQAAQAAAQGQSQLANYNNKAADYTTQYNQYQQQADAANKSVADYTDYMKGAGSAGNQYTGNLGTQLGNLGYDQGQMTAARGNLNQANGALSAYSDFANQAASKWGMNAGGFAAANAGALGSLNNNIASNQGVVNGLSDLYKTAQTGANQYAGLQVEGEKNTLAGLQQTFNNAASQRDSASSMMTFYDNLAQQQGGLNAQQQQYYAQATQAYASAQQALSQSAYLLSQTKGQDLANQMTTNNMNSKAYQQQLNGTRNAAGQVIQNGQPVVGPTKDQLAALSKASYDATANTLKTSGSDHGMFSMNPFSWLKMGLQ